MCKEQKQGFNIALSAINELKNGNTVRFWTVNVNLPTLDIKYLNGEHGETMSEISG